MNTKDNTILITGGGSGLGRGLAEAFHALGNGGYGAFFLTFNDAMTAARAHEHDKPQ